MLELITDLYQGLARLGPGSDASTRQALAFAEAAGLSPTAPLQIADLGCGTGAATWVLAQALPGTITAIDQLPAFLTALEARRPGAPLRASVETRAADFSCLPYPQESLDLLWSEGAIYNLGFAAGLAAWRPFLKPGGFLAVSELTWLTARRAAALEAFWNAAYPEVATASTKLAILEQQGFRPLGYFPLPPACWLEGFYEPLEASLPAFLARQGSSPEAKALAQEVREEAALYRRYGDQVGYGFYIAQRLA
jgi:SAM-dependent methyltransferase